MVFRGLLALGLAGVAGRSPGDAWGTLVISSRNHTPPFALQEDLYGRPVIVADREMVESVSQRQR